MSAGRPVQVIAVTGGKGGVGKSNISVKLGVSLARLGRRVVLMDADLGLANVDVLLGLKATLNLSDVLAGRCELRDIMLQAPGGLKVVPGASGLQQMASLQPREHAALIHAFSELDDQLDILIVDTAAGITDTVVSFVQASQEVVVVVCDEPSSITDAYALIKLMSTEYGTQRFRVIANMTRKPQEGRLLFNKLNTVCERFLDVTLQYVGQVPFDENIRKAVQKRQPVVDFAPSCRASQAFRAIAEQVVQWPLPRAARGHLEFFVERLLKTVNAGF